MFLEFLERASYAHPVIKKWRESTRTKLVQSILARLRDFGVLRGIQRKRIHRPVVSPEAVFHLLRVLLAEGHSGRAVLDAPDPGGSEALVSMRAFRALRSNQASRTARGPRALKAVGHSRFSANITLDAFVADLKQVYDYLHLRRPRSGLSGAQRRT
jgi:BrxA